MRHKNFYAAIFSATICTAGAQFAYAEPISIGALRFTSHAPTFIAFEKGYFRDEGLDASLKFFQAAQPVSVAIASGDIDFGITALTGGFFNLADKGALKVIGGLYTEEKGKPGMAIMASNKAFDAGLTSPEKLPGHTWGMTQKGSSHEYMIERISADYQLDLDTVKLVPLQKYGALVAALKTGNVDASAIVPHIAKPLADAGEARIIGNISDFEKPYQVSTIFTSSANVSDKPALVDAFMRAYKRAIDDYSRALADGADPVERNEVFQIIQKYVYSDKTADEARPLIAAGAVAFAKDARLDMASIADQLQWAIDKQLVPDRLTMEKLVAPQFVGAE
ncbi:ABC transporter substrate-binding protein [Mesorhizobium sp. NBSH29]|uniref:ABC transporter substrate-binding protein n=1 Tax=Mesorhizobium sp. NBSH29 TaxID=2654249 RepID=UPI00189663DA|nr:ABC transporter substrate-binding protein [Mesorhizobium sp. NBSH29]QPC86320.1 ABC transporter substrate-binding protein [Mesorhizobium sp. NBSH29]